VTDENVIFDGHAFADERMAGYLAVPSYRCVFLDLHKSADFRVISDRAPVEIDELRQPDVLSQLNVGSNTQKVWSIGAESRVFR